MKKYYVAQTYLKVTSAGSKPSSDFEKVLKSKGFKNIGLVSFYTKSTVLWHLWNILSVAVACIFMRKNSVVAIQYPDQRYIGILFARAKKLNCKILTLIHDINELRGWESLNRYILADSDVLIAHTESMKAWLCEQFKQCRVVVLQVFDCLRDVESELSCTSHDTEQYNIVFAGRLNKSGFLKKIEIRSSNIILHLYGAGFPEELAGCANIQYHGACLPDELAHKIESYDFGLVWDGEEICRCSGPMGEYLRYNCPYKFVTYLASGLPVIVWDKMAIAEFVKAEKIGIVVSSLDDIPIILKHVAKNDYLVMKQNAIRLSRKVARGEFYSDAVDAGLRVINC